MAEKLLLKKSCKDNTALYFCSMKYILPVCTQFNDLQETTQLGTSGPGCFVLLITQLEWKMVNLRPARK